MGAYRRRQGGDTTVNFGGQGTPTHQPLGKYGRVRGYRGKTGGSLVVHASVVHTRICELCMEGGLARTAPRWLLHHNGGSYHKMADPCQKTYNQSRGSRRAGANGIVRKYNCMGYRPNIKHQTPTTVTQNLKL